MKGVSCNLDLVCVLGPALYGNVFGLVIKARSLSTGRPLVLDADWDYAPGHLHVGNNILPQRMVLYPSRSITLYADDTVKHCKGLYFNQ